MVVRHNPLSDEAAAGIRLTSEPSPWLDKLRRDLRRAEPRIAFIDGGSLNHSSDALALPEALSALSEPPAEAAPADSLLGVTALRTDTDHPSGFIVPLLVSYQKVRSVATLQATIA